MASDRRKIHHHLAAGLLAFTVCVPIAPRGLAAGPARDAEGWVEGRLAAMTLEQKVGQMLMVDLKGQAFDDKAKAFMEAGRFGGVIMFDRNIQDVDQTRLLTRQLQNHAIIR